MISYIANADSRRCINQLCRGFVCNFSGNNCRLSNAMESLQLLHENCAQRALVDIQPDDFFLLSPVTVIRGHKYKLFKRGSKACVRANFFAERVINHWNSLPDSVNFSSFL